MVQKPLILLRAMQYKMQLYQRFDADVVPPACNFTKHKIPAHMFPFEFCEFFLSYHFMENGTPEQVFPCEF